MRLAAPRPSFCPRATEHHSAPSKARTAPSGSERCADATVRCTDATDGCTSLSGPLADPSTHRSDPSIRLTHPYAPSEPRAQPAERRKDPSAIRAAPSEGLTEPDGSARDADSSRPAPKSSRGGTRPSELRLDSCAPRTHPSARVTPRSHRCTHPYEECEHLGPAPVDLGSPPSAGLVRSAPSDQKLGSSGSTSAERDPLDDGAGYTRTPEIDLSRQSHATPIASFRSLSCSYGLLSTHSEFITPPSSRAACNKPPTSSRHGAESAMARRGGVDVLRGAEDTTPTPHHISFGREQEGAGGARREGWQGASDLTQPQRAAACHSPSAALVVYAPAGAGKTLTL
ncbi:MAG: hypothetical protein SGPRY_008362, partial [Prymnesium sp.]